METRGFPFIETSISGLESNTTKLSFGSGITVTVFLLLQNRVERLDNLLDGLLQYSRVSNKEQHVEICQFTVTRVMSKFSMIP